jgi:hypothetical protein
MLSSACSSALMLPPASASAPLGGGVGECFFSSTL